MPRDYTHTQYWIDGRSRLWSGPTNPEENVHYSTFHGYSHGEPIWILERSDEPDGRLIDEQTAMQLMREAEMFEAEINELFHALEETIIEYRQASPPGTVSKDGLYRMGQDGLWWGRCAPIPFLKGDDAVE